MHPESLKSQLTEHDVSSGLYRRDVVFRKLAELLESGASSRPVVMLLEIHRFKQINDGVGPEIGDRVILQFAKRLQRSAPDDAIIGRMGGDGFAVVLPSNKGLHAVVDKILEITRRPFSLGGNVIVLNLSMGIAVGELHGVDATQLIHEADIALHTILDDPAHEFVIYSEEMLSNARSMHLLENDLRYSIVLEKPSLIKALTSDQFRVYYQPQIDALTGKPLGVEALLRWNHPERGFISPEEFIPVSEDIGVIGALGAWVLRTACKDIAEIRAATAFSDLSLSVNVSPRQLEDIPQFLGQIDTALDESGFPPDALLLEITENAILQSNQDELESVLARHCSLALDDFGTGYSSMNVLRSLPIKAAKLDKVFVSNLFREESDLNKKDEQMIRAFQSMCSALNIRTTIEGIETEEQANFLRQLGCNELQGFYYSRPLPIEKLRSYLDEF